MITLLITLITLSVCVCLCVCQVGIVDLDHSASQLTYKLKNPELHASLPSKAPPPGAAGPDPSNLPSSSRRPFPAYSGGDFSSSSSSDPVSSSSNSSASPSSAQSPPPQPLTSPPVHSADEPQGSAQLSAPNYSIANPSITSARLLTQTLNQAWELYLSQQSPIPPLSSEWYPSDPNTPHSGPEIEGLLQDSLQGSAPGSDPSEVSLQPDQTNFSNTVDSPIPQPIDLEAGESEGLENCDGIDEEAEEPMLKMAGDVKRKVKRNTRRCGVCGVPGHNRRTCPEL